MRADKRTLDKIDLHKAAKEYTSDAFDRMPHLISQRSLQGEEATLAAHVRGFYEGENVSTSVIMSMPRQGFGSRPVTIASPAAHVMLSALVNAMNADLATPSRGPGTYKAHQNFGLTPEKSYIIDFDIVACYEYVDHNLLAQELNRRGVPGFLVSDLTGLLKEMYHNGRGLPQLLHASDLLADTYLDVITRRLARLNLRVSRYVDDFRVVADDWQQANAILEIASDAARLMGLTLSQSKSRINRADRLLMERRAEEEELKAYFKAASVTIMETIEVPSEYGTWTAVVTADDDEATEIAMRDLITDWNREERSRQGDSPEHATPSHSWRDPWLVPALVAMKTASERLPDDLLEQLIFRKPTRLQYVCEYVISRKTELDQNWKTLERLIGDARQTSWGSLWLLQVVSELFLESEPSVNASAAKEKVVAWVKERLSDPHEIVRAQAAWATAQASKLTDDSAWRLYSDCTDVTAHALSASIAHDSSISTKVAESVRRDTALNGRAANWASKQVPSARP